MMSDLRTIGRAARDAAAVLADLPTATKNRALAAAATALRAAAPQILTANLLDLNNARDAALNSALLDRLTLTAARIDAMAQSLEAIAALPDPIGETMETWKRPNGLDIHRVRIPLGVIAVIYEARPNVTSDIAGLCVKSGNAAVLRGSSSAAESNQAVVGAIGDAFDAAGLPAASVQLVADSSRQTARELMRQREHIDLLIPRGGPALIADIREHATVPYVIDGDGNCHVYVDASADLEMAARIVINAKTSRSSVCNAAEKLLVHSETADTLLTALVPKLRAKGVELRGDEAARKLIADLVPTTDDDWSREYLDLIMAIKVVDDIDAAIAHIRRYSSGHTEAIVTADTDNARRFINAMPSAVVMVNASTRFTDGGEFGFGAEIGNSTQRIHARGPMGLRELTTYRLEVWGTGQIRE